MMFSKLQRQLPTIHIDESVKMENAWVEALSLDSRDFNANFIHCIAGYIFIFKKIVLKCLSNEGLHSTAIYLLSTLSTFSWEAKLTTMLASLAIIHGEFSVKGLAHQINLTYISSNVLLIATSNHSITLRYNIQHYLLQTTGLQEVLCSCLCNTFCPPSYNIMGIKSQNQLKEQPSLAAKVKDIYI
ncbi:uncharacterized protein LOC116017219 isoform X1 [Ipomoea triloba]|uniref:uncharacterized protein LOC116017219 isoform X1 n=1 Tax=Ipomoea triloba TaxID=35885 RepID=UPI00125D3A05|nr:uncharacterized protein LOC116017219 isoform X1 [Ipomoea triloba]XP_031113618.1 uncharacterized protein LOC116017219 isoform X1 [Ipomoea triloba]